MNANELLKQYAKEEQETKQWLKRERMLWMTIARVLLVRGVAK